MASLEKIAESIARMESRLEAITSTNQVKRPWINSDEAAELLGYPKQAQNRQRRKLTAYYLRGFLSRKRQGKGFVYKREEVEQLRNRILKDEVCFF